jgi:hypothetical protein
MIANALIVTISILLALAFWLMGELKFLIAQILPQRHWPQALALGQASRLRPRACTNPNSRRGAALTCPVTSHPRIWRMPASP